MCIFGMGDQNGSLDSKKSPRNILKEMLALLSVVTLSLPRISARIATWLLMVAKTAFSSCTRRTSKKNSFSLFLFVPVSQLWTNTCATVFRCVKKTQTVGNCSMLCTRKTSLHSVLLLLNSVLLGVCVFLPAWPLSCFPCD